jgi:hypothetical protein
MTDPTLADVVSMLRALNTNLTAVKAELTGLMDKSASTSNKGGGRLVEPHDLDRPPRFQKLDFPRYDGKPDPLLFINKCESYFHQQRTMPEEKMWMASYNLEDVAQLWFIQLQDDEGMPPWGRSKELLHLRFGPPLRSAPCSSSPNAVTRGPSRNTPTDSKPSFPMSGGSRRHNEYSYTPVACLRRSVTKCASTTRSLLRRP